MEHFKRPSASLNANKFLSHGIKRRKRDVAYTPGTSSKEGAADDSDDCAGLSAELCGLVIEDGPPRSAEDVDSCFEVWTAKDNCSPAKDNCSQDKAELQVKIESNSFGSLVWGRLSKTRWWPGIIIDGTLFCWPPPQHGWVWLMWFGDFKITKLSLSKVQWFGCQYKERITKISKKAEIGVAQALQVCAKRLGVEITNCEKTWTEEPSAFCSILQSQDGQIDPLAPKPGEEYPESVLRSLNDFWSSNRRHCAAEQQLSQDLHHKINPTRLCEKRQLSFDHDQSTEHGLVQEPRCKINPSRHCEKKQFSYYQDEPDELIIHIEKPASSCESSTAEHSKAKKPTRAGNASAFRARPSEVGTLLSTKDRSKSKQSAFAKKHHSHSSQLPRRCQLVTIPEDKDSNDEGHKETVQEEKNTSAEEPLELDLNEEARNPENVDSMKARQEELTKSEKAVFTTLVDQVTTETMESDHARSEEIEQGKEQEESTAKLGDPDVASSFGRLVWGRLSKTRWWPGIIIDGTLVGQPSPKPGWAWLMWFGDFKITMLPLSKVEWFGCRYEERIDDLGTLAEQGVTQAFQVCAVRLGVELDDHDSVWSWVRAPDGFSSKLQSGHGQDDPLGPKVGEEYPDLILSALQDLIGARSTRAAQYSEKRAVLKKPKRKRKNQADLLKLEKEMAQKYKATIEESWAALKPSIEQTLDTSKPTVLSHDGPCLSCTKPIWNGKTEHPLFEGSICLQCEDDHIEAMFAIDDDGSYVYCSICSQPGSMIVCEGSSCARSYCIECLAVHLGQDKLKQIQELGDDETWSCFLCSEYRPESHGDLKPRLDWQHDIVAMFNLTDTDPETTILHESSAIQQCQSSTTKKNDSPTTHEEKVDSGANVLSLADGIGTVRVTLDHLGVQVDNYYAAEIDQNALNITLCKNDKVTDIGNILDIDETSLDKFPRFDLVVAAPPVPTVEEPQNTDHELVLKKCIILITRLQDMAAQDGLDFHWLLEAPTNIQAALRKEVSQVFEMEPAMWDAQFFSPVSLPKFYWGNIPHLNSAVSYVQQHGFQIDLQKYLVNNDQIICKALVSHIRPSVLQGLPPEFVLDRMLGIKNSSTQDDSDREFNDDDEPPCSNLNQEAHNLIGVLDYDLLFRTFDCDLDDEDPAWDELICDSVILDRSNIGYDGVNQQSDMDVSYEMSNNSEEFVEEANNGLKANVKDREGAEVDESSQCAMQDNSDEPRQDARQGSSNKSYQTIVQKSADKSNQDTKQEISNKHKRHTMQETLDKSSQDARQYSDKHFQESSKQTSRGKNRESLDKHVKESSENPSSSKKRESSTKPSQDIRHEYTALSLGSGLVMDLYKDGEDPFHFKLPVTWGGYPSELFTEEMEKLMGFDRSYTDLDSSRGVRMQLLSNSSSVHVLKHLLTPLIPLWPSKPAVPEPEPFWKSCRKLHFLLRHEKCARSQAFADSTVAQ